MPAAIAICVFPVPTGPYSTRFCFFPTNNAPSRVRTAYRRRHRDMAVAVIAEREGNDKEFLADFHSVLNKVRLLKIGLCSPRFPDQFLACALLIPVVFILLKPSIDHRLERIQLGRSGRL